MPHKPNKPCAHPGCAKLVPPTEMYCEKHKPLHPVIEDRPSSTERGYNSAWQRARQGYLADHPLCVECMKHGRYVKATDVDHIIPHCGDRELFWDRDNWQSLCHECHSKKTATEDRAATRGRGRRSSAGGRG